MNAYEGVITLLSIVVLVLGGLVGYLAKQLGDLRAAVADLKTDIAVITVQLTRRRREP